MSNNVKFEEMGRDDFINLVKDEIESEKRTCPENIHYISLHGYEEYIRGIIHAYRVFVKRLCPPGDVYEYSDRCKGLLKEYSEFLENRII